MTLTEMKKQIDEIEKAEANVAAWRDWREKFLNNYHPDNQRLRMFVYEFNHISPIIPAVAMDPMLMIADAAWARVAHDCASRRASIEAAYPETATPRT